VPAGPARRRRAPLLRRGPALRPHAPGQRQNRTTPRLLAKTPPTASPTSPRPTTCSTSSCPTPTRTKSTANWARPRTPHASRPSAKAAPCSGPYPPAPGGPTSGASKLACASATTARFPSVVSARAWTLRRAAPSSAANGPMETSSTSGRPPDPKTKPVVLLPCPVF
jgi:hypothetical protein